MKNDYKEECWKRYLENQKYERYDKEDLIDEIIELQAEIQEVNDSITWWTNRFNAVERDNRDYKSRIDKAIEYIEIELSQGGERELRDLVDGYEVLKLLKGDSDE